MTKFSYAVELLGFVADNVTFSAMKAYAGVINLPFIVLHAVMHSQSCSLCKQPCCCSGRLFSSLFGSHDHHPQTESPTSHGEQPVSSPAAESASHHTQAAGTGTRSVASDMGGSRQQGPEGVGDDESMAESDADLRTARQAQREALQAEQESLSDSRQRLMQVRESLQHQQPGTFLPFHHFLKGKQRVRDRVLPSQSHRQRVMFGCLLLRQVCLPVSLLLSWSELLAF